MHDILPPYYDFMLTTAKKVYLPVARTRPLSYSLYREKFLELGIAI